MGNSLVFGDCRLHVDGQLVMPAGKKQISAHQALLLRCLAEARSVAVPSGRLLDIAWGEGAGTPQNLAKAVFGLRRALAASECVHIESVYGYGYRLALKGPNSLEPAPEQMAMTICHEATHRLYNRSKMSLNAARAMYERAVLTDPSCVPAYLGHAYTWLLLMQSGFQSPSTVWPALQDTIGELLVTVPACAEALAYRGLIEGAYHWDFPGAEATLAEALASVPADVRVNQMAGRVVLFQSQGRRAIHYFETALALNPIAMTTRGAPGLRLDHCR